METILIIIAEVSLSVIVFGSLIGAGYYIYDQKIRRFKPSEYGIEDFQRIAQWETDGWRDRAYNEGITRSEWRYVLMRQRDEISAELKRRGNESE